MGKNRAMPETWRQQAVFAMTRVTVGRQAALPQNLETIVGSFLRKSNFNFSEIFSKVTSDFLQRNQPLHVICRIKRMRFAENSKKKS